MSLTTERSNDDLSALAWVHDELRRSLDAAHKSLRRYVKENDALGGADIDAVDPAVLRTARSQIHQGVGALELVGQPSAAMVLRASEALVQRFIAKPHKLTLAIVEDIERASFALLDYLTRLLAGKQVSTLALFPPYRAVLEAAGAERVHPADLWPHDWQWRDLPADPSVPPLAHDAATQAAIEAQLLPLMRSLDPASTAGRMGDICAGLGAGATEPRVSTLWKLASAVFEAQAQRLLGFDVFSKRVASRLLAQFRMIARGETDVSERLAQDLLFFCAQAKFDDHTSNAPRLAAVRRVYGLVDEPADYSASALGRFDPSVITQAKKRVVAAKDAWSAVAGGEMHRMTGLSEQFALVGESLKKLFPHGDVFASELQHAVAQTQQAAAAPPAPLAMEVATSLLYTEAALEDADFDHPEQAERVRRLAERLGAVRRGNPPEQLEGWMEDLYRRVSDRQTMGSVVQELRASLSEAEKLIDAYFRTPAERQVLIPVPGQLQAMRGVLSVLGMDHAAAALLRMRDEVDALASTEIDPQHITDTGVFDRLAGNLGALGFLIDMLSVQPQMAKSLFSFDAEAGVLSPVMGRSAVHVPEPAASPVPQVAPELVEQAQLLAFSSVREDVPVGDVTRDLERLTAQAHASDQPALAATAEKARVAIVQAADAAGVASARGDLSEALVDFVASVSDPVTLDQGMDGTPASAPSPLDVVPPNSVPAAAHGVAELAQDDEMREVFLEEATEVLAHAREASAALAQGPDDLQQLTALRRTFHTLKGSSRMVGLKDFGEGAWACEQIYNVQLADQSAASRALIDFTDSSLRYLGGWVDEISTGGAITHDSATLIEAARVLGEAPAPQPVEADSMHGGLAEPELPRLPAFASDFGELPSHATEPETQARAAEPAEPSFGFLDSFTLPEAAPAPAAPPLAEPLDIGAYELQHTFDVPTEPLPLPDIIETSASGVDLDLDFDLDFGAVPTPAPVPSPVLSDFENSEHMSLPFAEMAEPAPVSSADATPDDQSAGEHVAQPEPETQPGHETQPEHAHEARPEPAAPLSGAEATPEVEPAPAVHEPEPLTESASGHGGLDDELVKIVGPLRIGIPLFNIYLNEADELSRRLGIELAEWAMELHRPIGESPVALAHSLAGSSATVGFADLSHLARLLEHAQARSLAIGHGTPEEASLFVDAADEIRRLLHQFAAGFLKEPSAELLQRLADHELSSARRLEAAAAAAELPPVSERGDLPLPAEEGAAVELLDAEPSHAEPPRVEPQHAEPPHAEPPHPEHAPAEALLAEPSPAEPTHAEADSAETSLLAAADSAASEPEPQVPAVSTDEALIDVQEEVAPPAPATQSEAQALRVVAEPDESAQGVSASSVAAPTGAFPVEAAGVESVSSDAPLSEPTPTEASEPLVDLPRDSSFGQFDTRFHPLDLDELKPPAEPPQDLPRATAISDHSLIDGDDAIDAVDAVDEELFPIFEEEAQELLPQLASRLRDWTARPHDPVPPAACMRTLHTLKGGARLAGAMRLGEMAHRLETRIEQLLADPPVPAHEVEALQAYGDTLVETFDILRGAAPPEAHLLTRAAAASPSAAPPAAQDQLPIAAAAPAEPVGSETALDSRWQPIPDLAPPLPFEPEPDSEAAPLFDSPLEADTAALEEAVAPAAPAAPGRIGPSSDVDWSRFPLAAPADRKAPDRVAATQSAVRVRAPLLDRLVNQAGEVSITRSRIDAGVQQIKHSLGDLTENLERLRAQLRDIEFHGEVQMTSRLEAAKAASQTFDPLEFDRFTRFQELTRMMAESVNDVATVQRSLQRALETAEDELVAQARMTRELHDDLLRTRMVEFEGLSDRLYRVARQAAKETGKSVRLDIVGGSIEVDRGVLDRMTGSFEHLLRNGVTHGIERPESRTAAGKDATGSITVTVTHEGNEVGVEFRDDGAGLDMPRIRAKGIALGLLAPDAEPTDGDLANLIFAPGFSTAETVTELAGRGVGMDVVRSEVSAMGGRIETASALGRGTSFKLILPLTTAVTQVVMLRCGATRVAVPSTLVEVVRRATPAEVEQAYASGTYDVGGQPLRFFWLGALLQVSPRAADSDARTRSVVVIRSAQQRVVLHVDEVIGNQEVVVKNLGPQLSRLPGLAGITLLASGAVALIYNPVALATLYGETAREATRQALQAPQVQAAAPVVDHAPQVPEAPLVMVVDDSLTVRRVTQRLLQREGYRVVLAKDGLDALERLSEALPQIVLSDIEMPRMDGFDLVRNMRNDARLRELPVIMITSRIAQKHRDYAAQLGVDHYLGKPYSEEDLLALVARYTRSRVAA